MTKTFDSKCLELAQHFYPTAAESFLRELAGDIQDLVESHDEPAPSGAGSVQTNEQLSESDFISDQWATFNRER